MFGTELTKIRSEFNKRYSIIFMVGKYKELIAWM